MTTLIVKHAGNQLNQALNGRLPNLHMEKGNLFLGRDTSAKV